MKIISSTQNRSIKEMCDLHTPKGRKEAQAFIAEGIRILESFSQAQWNPEQLYVIEDHLKNASELFPHINQAHIFIVSYEVMKKISTATTPSGILAVFAIPQPSLPITLSSGIVLAQIQDPGNMGTLIRSATAFGYKTVVLVEGCDPYSSKVIQSTAGTIAYMQLISLSWDELLQNKGSLNLCALVVNNGTEPQKLNVEHSLLVVGNEAHGLPDAWIQQCQQRMTIPMHSSTESLNAAVAGSIALFLLKNNK